jgi:hypothetical protein
VKTFITEHEPHGELTGDDDEPTSSGYRLWIKCPCGVTFERSVVRTTRLRTWRGWRG